MGYICANFGLPIGLSVLELFPMYATDRRQTKASGRGHNNIDLYKKQSRDNLNNIVLPKAALQCTGYFVL